MLARTPANTRLLIPGLAGFYDWAPEVGYLLLRVTMGAIFFVHGWNKVQAGFAAEVAFFVRAGFALPALCAFAVIFLETVAAACVTVGLFTRFFAAAIAVELGVIFIAFHGPKGFSVSKGGYEYVLLMGVVVLFIALAGGRRYSVDRVIGKEL
ncbi:MAG: DoxX family protein [Proteobacteria bacterium]|nr:DoxX family protein [Pseudomonadota bacterium]